MKKAGNKRKKNETVGRQESEHERRKESSKEGIH